VNTLDTSAAQPPAANPCHNGGLWFPSDNDGISYEDRPGPITLSPYCMVMVGAATVVFLSTAAIDFDFTLTTTMLNIFHQ
jgi:hypothetical protein